MPGPNTTPTSTVVWWHEPQHDMPRDDAPHDDGGGSTAGTFAIRWATLGGVGVGRPGGGTTGEQVSRTGELRVSRRTADPDNPYDPSIAVDLHRELSTRFGLTIKVEPVANHLPALDVRQRLGVRRCAVHQVELPPQHRHVLGALYVDVDSRTAQMVVDRGLAVNARDIVLLWAEKRLPDLADPSLATIMEVKATTSSGWQHRPDHRYELFARADAIHLFT